jgi:L-ascorbate metabolism protein UlaG (beta-lactamase superfamily)
MRIQWYGQSAFALGGGTSVFIDPFGDVSAAAPQLPWEYPLIEGVSAEVAMITHEHLDHNGIEVIGGDPIVIRSLAGTFESPLGPVKAVAAEHDPVAGTERGPNTILVFELDGIRIAHFGDFGQSALRPEQAEAIGQPDLLFVPVGGGPTIDGAGAHRLIEQLRPRWVVPMHYRTERLGFLEPADAFLSQAADVHTADATSFDTNELPSSDGALVVLPAVP